MSDYEICFIEFFLMVFIGYYYIRQSLVSILTMACFLLLASNLSIYVLEMNKTTSTICVIVFWIYLLSSVFVQNKKQD